MDPLIRLKEATRILFTGDSITDASRRQIAYAPLGRGYVNFVGNLLLAKYPELDLAIVNTGVSGNTTRELADRWQRDVIAHNPDVLSVLIGINDVWTQYAGREYLPYAVYPQEFENTYGRLLAEARQQCNCEIVLIEPFMFCANRKHPMYEGLLSYIKIVRDIAGRFGAILVPAQQRLDEALQGTAEEKWSADMVHPEQWAHAWIARLWLDVTGL